MPGYITTLVYAEASSQVGQQAVQWLMSNAVKFGSKLIVAGVLFLIGSSLVSLVRKFVKRLLVRKKLDAAVASFVNSLTNVLLKVLLAILLVGVLGIPTISFAAIVAAAGLAVGMAMKDNLSNFAGGVMILLNKPFSINDRIVAQNQDGVVQEIGILYTVLLTADGRTVYMPNGPLSTGSIVNYSTRKIRRVDLTFNFPYRNNADELVGIMKRIVESDLSILKDPPPFVGITSLNNANFDISVRVWALNADNAKVSTDLTNKIYRDLTKNNIFVPIT